MSFRKYLNIYFLSFSIFFTLSLSLNAQTTIAGSVTDSLNNPIPFASVYLSNTTIGAITDNKGAYSLSFPQEGIFELITSCIGYKTYSKTIHAENKSLLINVKLKVNSVSLDEVTIKAKSKNRIKNYSQFIKLFIGESVNAQNCTIVNLDDLRLYQDSQGNITKGYSVKPLKIENKALGYTITYDLTDFSYNQTTKILRFLGGQFFQPLKGSSRKVKKWEHNRLAAYYGSKMHLFRALITDSLARENYKIYECDLNTITDEYTIIKPLQVNDLIQSFDKNYTTFYYRRPILISYTENHSALPTGFMGFQPEEYKSTIIFSKPLKVQKNGRFDNPNVVTWGGQMAKERVADMIPFDFLPYAKSKEKPDYDNFESAVNGYLEFQQNSISQDQVFVHTDRNKYVPGDTLYFQVYIRNRFSGEFNTSSISMYAMLYNDQKEMVDSSRFKIDGATASGWLAFPNNAKSGKYRFVALTSRMQNYDPKDAFYLDLYLNSINEEAENVDISFNKDNYQPGDTLEATIKITNKKANPINNQKFQYSLISNSKTIEDYKSITNSSGESFIRLNIPDTITHQLKLQINISKSSKEQPTSKNFDIPIVDKFIDLRFLPEGGTFIEGAEQRIGFNATNRKGEPIFIEGLIKNSKGKVLDVIKSGPYGPGLFNCIPEKGMYLEITNGVTDHKLWPLPEIADSGMCLKVLPINSKSFAIEIQSTDYNGDSIFVIATTNFNQIFAQSYILKQKQRIEVETDQLPAGIAQIVLFNKEKIPVAERLYYINADKRLKFNINTQGNIYHPDNETELTIDVTDGLGNPVKGVFSLAVVDSISGHSAEMFAPGIEYALNYNPYLICNLPSSVLIKGIENLTDRERDLLLMVYGWKKYSWDFRQVTRVEPKKSVNYDFLTMKILYALKNRQKERKLDLFSLEGPSIIHLKTNEVGEIKLPLDSLPKITNSVVLMPSIKNEQRVLGATMTIPSNQQYFKNRNFFASLPTLPTSNYSNLPVFNPYTSLSDKTIEIQGVFVKGRRKSEIKYVNKYAEMYKDANTQTIEGEPLSSSSSLAVALYKVTTPDIVSDNFSAGGKVYIRRKTSFFGPRMPVLFVLDGLPLYNTDDAYGIVKSILPSDIESITVLKGPQGWAMYGEPSKGGVIFINTKGYNRTQLKHNNDSKSRNNQDKMLLPINIYRTNIEFYNPTKAEIDLNPELQNSSTIFWKSDILFNGKDPVKIKYPNLKHVKHDGKVLITINGVSIDNMVGTGRASYLVKRDN